MVQKRVGILTAGGDCPGLNAAIRGVGKTAILKYGMEVIGFTEGYSGLIHGDYIFLDEERLTGILTLGGTILGTSREKPFKKDKSNPIDKVAMIKRRYVELNLDCLVCLGGNGTMKTAYKLSEVGLNVIGLPKTIDNDVFGTDVTFGFDSAVTIATDAIDRLYTTASSHKRVMVIELMGHHSGWIALNAGLAGGGDVILLPEIGYDMDILAKDVVHKFEQGKPYAIVVVAEGIDHPKKISAGQHIANEIGERTGIEVRDTKLGYVQRGGSPTAMDRVLATRYGTYAAKLIAKGKYNRMVALRGDKITSLSLEEVGGKLNLVTTDHPLVNTARDLGISFGYSFDS